MTNVEVTGGVHTLLVFSLSLVELCFSTQLKIYTEIICPRKKMSKLAF